MGCCTPAKTGSSETGWGIQHGVVLASDAGCASKTGGPPTCSGVGFSNILGTAGQCLEADESAQPCIIRAMPCIRANALLKGKHSLA